MSESRLERWSRLKRAAREAPVAVEPAASAEARPPADEAAVPALADPQPDAKAERKPGDLAVFDITKLPSIESLGPGSDLKAFMQPGVPEELRLRAMRRLWSVDPAIRDFRTPAEYDWNFNAPGYGALLPTDDVAKILAGIIRTVAKIDAEAAKTHDDNSVPLQPAAPAPVDAHVIPPAAPPPAEPAPSAEEPEPIPETPPRRRHGGAAPA